MGLHSIFFASVLVLPTTTLATQVENNIRCTAEVYESLSDGSARKEKVPLAIEVDNSQRIVLTVDLDGRSFTLNGEKTGPYLVSITEAPNYTKGSITTAEFSAEGRLQLSTVNKNLVHKIECFNK